MFEMKCLDDDEVNEEILKTWDDVHGGVLPSKKSRNRERKKLDIWNREASGVINRFRTAGIKREDHQCQ